MAASSLGVVLGDFCSSRDRSSVLLLNGKNGERKVLPPGPRGTSVSGFPLRIFDSPAYSQEHGVVSWPEQFVSPKPSNSCQEIVMGHRVLSFSRSRGFPLGCHSSELAVVRPWDVALHKDGSSQKEDSLWICKEEQISQECCLRRDNYADGAVGGAVSADSSRDITNRGLSESLARMDHSQAQETSELENIVSNVRTPEYSTGSCGSAVSGLEIQDSSSGSTGIESLSSVKSQDNDQKLPALSIEKLTPISFRGPCNSKYEKEMEVAVRAVQLSCMLSQSIQQRVVLNEENTDFKKDRSVVTVADWGVQAVVSWVLSQAAYGEEIPMIAEEDTTGLRGMEKIDLLQRVVAAVNDCLQHAEIVGVSPPPRSLGALDVLKAINRGSAEGGPKGRYWVLDPVDGTLGFVRGDQYAVALALIEDGEVVLAVLGCPNFPLRKQWLVHHHRYYRIASRLNPPSPSKWHKGLILTTTKGAGEVIMWPLIMNADGLPQWDETRQMAKSVSVSSIDDPAKVTFCEPFEKANSSHSFTAGLAVHLGLRNRPLRVYSMAKYAAIARGDAEIFMKFAKVGYREKIWDHAAGVLIVQEAGGVVTDAGGRPLDFSQGRFLDNLDRGIIACSGKTLHDKLLKAVDASWNSSRL